MCDVCVVCVCVWVGVCVCVMCVCLVCGVCVCLVCVVCVCVVCVWCLVCVWCVWCVDSSNDGAGSSVTSDVQTAVVPTSLSDSTVAPVMVRLCLLYPLWLSKCGPPIFSGP